MHDLIAALVEKTDDLAAITDPRGKLLYLNDSARQILGISRKADILDLNIESLLSGTGRMRIAGETGEGNNNNGPSRQNLIAAAQQADSSRLFKNITAHRDQAGDITCFSIHSSYLTGKQRNDRDLCNSPEKLQALINASQSILAAASSDRAVEKALEAACGLAECRYAAFCEAKNDHHFRIKSYYLSERSPDNHIKQATELLNYKALRKLLENQHTLRLSEALWPQRKEESRQPSAKRPVSEILCTGMIEKPDDTPGIILLLDPDKESFSQEDEALLAQLASFTSLAFRNFRARQISDHMSVEISQVFSALAEPVIVYEKSGTPIMANPAAIKMMGFDPVGIPWKKFIQKKALQYPNGQMVPFEKLPCNKALAGNPVRSEKYLRPDARGYDRIYEFNAVPLMHNEQITGAVTVARDETERNRLMEQLETERTALQAIINNAPEAIVVVDEECRIVMTNPAARQLYQQSPAFQKGRDTEIVHFNSSAPYDPVDLPLCRSVFKGEMIVDHELTVYLPNKQPRYILVNTAPIRSPKGEITGAVGIFHDITRRKRERLELKKARTELEKRVEERTAELQSLSRRMLNTLESDRQKIAKELHDSLGASLAAIKFSLEEKLARMPSEPPDRIMSLENIVNYLTGTIKETKRISANLRPTILDDLGLLATITWFCREFNCFYKNIRISEQIEIREEEIEEPMKIVIYRILQEAMNNAAKHGQPENIRLSLKKNSDRIELTVADDGSGFDVESRLNSSDPMSGHGIQGMRERANVCGGKFEIRSAPGDGTLVSVGFPYPSCLEPYPEPRELN
ncbi:MAG: PAS domain-containing protein [Desulfobacteraceae bacterium]|nr:PAS domain-containing protein [Desulfobacteraceae bacterium]